MPRNESVTDEYVAKLQTGFLAQAERVKAAGSWGETRTDAHLTYPYSIAVGHVDAGWTQEEIARSLR